MKHFMQEIGKNFISFMISLPLKLRYSQEYFQPKIGTKIRILSLGYKKQYSHTLEKCVFQECPKLIDVHVHSIRIVLVIARKKGFKCS